MLTVSTEKDRVLAIIKRIRYVTQSQLASLMGCSLKTSNKHLNDLIQTGQLEALQGVRPSAYRLSTRVATALDVEYQRKWRSPAAIHQYLMKNEVEIQLRKRWSSFQMLSAQSVKSFGLNLAKAEWPARFKEDEDNVYQALVLIDDYLMSPERLRESLLREHSTKNNKEYLQRVRDGKIDKVPRWDQYVSYCFVATTFPERVSVFQKAIDEMYDTRTKRVVVNGKTSLVNVATPDHVLFEVIQISPIWRIS